MTVSETIALLEGAAAATTFVAAGLASVFLLSGVPFMARKRKATVIDSLPPGVTLRVSRDASGNTRVVEERNTEPEPVEPPSPRRVSALPILPDEPVLPPSDVDDAAKELLDNVYRVKRGRRKASGREIATGWHVIQYVTPQEKEKGMDSELRPLPPNRLYLFSNIVNVNGAGRVANPYGEALHVYTLTGNLGILQRMALLANEQRPMQIGTRHVVMASVHAALVTDFRPIFQDAGVLLF